MKNITLTIAIMFLILSSSVIFAEAGTSTRSSVTKTTTTSTTTNANDNDIVSAVYSKYAKDAALIGTKLTVGSQNGIVTISGTVTSQSQADEAAIAAKSVAGVKDVKSFIQVTTNPSFNKTTTTPNY